MTGDGPSGACATEVCVQGANGPECKQPECGTGETRCVDASTRQVCSSLGVWMSESCAMASGSICQGGQCLDECAIAAQKLSYAGCEYWSAIQDNAVDRIFRGMTASGQGMMDSDFAFVVANSSTFAATVDVYRFLNGAEVMVKSATVSGKDASDRGLRVINVPWQSLGASNTQTPNIATTGILRYGYHLKSNRPIVVYQFNPLPAGKWWNRPCNPMNFGIECTDQVDWHFPPKCDTPPGGTQPMCHYFAYSNDASLLIPAHSLGTSHVIVTPDHLARTNDRTLPPTDAFSTDLTVVGTTDHTMVQVRSTAVTMNGTNVPAIGKGQTQTFMLNSYDVLQIASDSMGAQYSGCAHDPFFGPGNGPPLVCYVDNDLTGSLVTADQPIAVFAGAAATIIPNYHAAADHVEEQIFPNATWGKRFIAVKTNPVHYGNGMLAPYSKMSADRYKIVASCPPRTCSSGTLITLSRTPTQSAVLLGQNRCSSGNLLTNDCRLMGGQWVELASKDSFVIEADQPIAVAQFISSLEDTLVYDPMDPFDSLSRPSEGDPAMIMLPPEEQWRSSYQLLAAPGFTSNYLALVMDQSTAASVDVDGVRVTGFMAIAGTNYAVANVPVANGGHSIRVHPVWNNQPGTAGVTVYGYDYYTAYGYTGGLDLHPINPIDPK
jgi:hypothetical protein